LESRRFYRSTAASGIRSGRGRGLASELIAHAPRSYQPRIDLHRMLDERQPARSPGPRRNAARLLRLGAHTLTS
jgi:hypothetical protein